MLLLYAAALLAAANHVAAAGAADFRVTSVTPSSGTALGGTRLHVDGHGFTTDFFAARNDVWLCKDDLEDCAVCNVIEGACTVDCGGPTRIVCDTGPWR